jgi:hypothetical protein
MGRRVRCTEEANYFVYYKRLGAIAKLATRYLLKNKGFKEERMTKVGLYAIDKSTTLESNKSPARYRETSAQIPSIRVSRAAGHPSSKFNFPVFRSAATQTPPTGCLVAGCS